MIICRNQTRIKVSRLGWPGHEGIKANWLEALWNVKGKEQEAEEE